MIHVIGFIISILIEAAIVITMAVTLSLQATLTFLVISSIISIIWMIVLLSLIDETVKMQAEGLREYELQERKRDALVEKCNKDKESYEAALIKYKEEVQASLLDKYKEFEETLMDKVRDSKLIAVIIKKSGYADVIERYHANIVNLTDEIKRCDITIASTTSECKTNKLKYAKEMLIRQSRGLYGFHYFFPKRLIFKE